MISILIWLLISIALVFVATLLLSSLQRISNVAAIVLIALAVSAYLIQTEFRTTEGVFVYLKFLTLAFSALVVAVFRFSKEPPRWTRMVLFLILMLNILEAVGFELLDIMIGGPQRSCGGSVPNALAGLLLVACQAGPSAIRRSVRSHVEYDLGMLWIGLYVIWNFVFVYGTNPPGQPTGEWAGLAVVHLSIPVLLMGKRGLGFAEMRLYSLYLVMGSLLLVPFAPFIQATPEWHNRTIADALGWLTFSIALLLMTMQLWNRPSEGKGLSLVQFVAGAWLNRRGRLP